MKPLNASQLTILQHLHKFRFLTTGQLLRLGVSKHRPHANRLLRDLRAGPKPLVGRTNYPTDPKRGKLESIHHLTPAGFQVLRELQLTEHLPPTGAQAYKDYYHRVHTIDIHIAFWEYCRTFGLDLVVWTNYFDRARGEAATALRLSDGSDLLPDALAVVGQDRKAFLFAIEMYNGQDVTRTMRQLRKHVQGLADGAVAAAYNLEKNHYVLCVFEVEALMASVQKAVAADDYFAKSLDYFGFKTLQSIRTAEPPPDTWLRASGSPLVLW